MEIDAKMLSEGIRKILDVERAHLFGAKTGSDSARRREVESVLGRVLDEFANQASSQQSAPKNGVGLK